MGTKERIAQQYSVILPLYKNDTARWFTAALESITTQTIPSDDIVVVVDGPIGSMLEKALHAARDTHPEVSVVRIEKNHGLWNALNIAMAQAKHELIMRMDADDIAVPERAAIQLAAFAADPALSVMGGQIAEFENEPDNIVSHRRVPTAHDDIVAFAKLRSPFNHPTVMFKKSVVQQSGGYAKLRRMEDYDLWARLLMAGAQTANTDKVLLYYRLSRANQQRKNSWQQQKEAIALHRRFLRMGFVTWPQYMVATTVKLGYFLLPSSLKSLFYKKLLRPGSK